MITATFGTGGTYAMLSDAITAILPSNYAYWGDDYELAQVGDCDQGTTLIDISVGQLRMNGHTLTIKSNSSHNGNPNSGYKITSDNADGWNISGYIGTQYTGNIYLTDLNLKFSIGKLNLLGYSSFAVTQTIYINKCILGSISVNGTPLKMTSCKLDAFSLGPWGASSSNKLVVENTSILTTATFNGLSNNIVRNSYARNWTAVYYTLGENNASVSPTSGGWGSGSQWNITGIVEANEFESIDPMDDDWLFLKDGVLLGKSGTTPQIATTDISGHPIPYYGYYPIGCHVSSFTKQILVLQRYKHIAKRLNSDVAPAVYSGKVYGQFNTPGELNLPQSVAFDSTNFFICDQNNNRIIKIDKNYNLISTYNTSDTVGKPIAIIYNNLNLIVIGMYQLRYLRAEKLDTNLNSLLISDNLTPNILNNFASICMQNSSSYIITGFNLGYYILTNLTSSFSISTRQFITGKPETSYKSPKTHYNSVIKHSNGSYYFNDSRQIFRTDANFVANGNSNKFYKIYSNLFGLKEGLDETLITYSRNDKKVLRFDKNLNFVEEIYTNTGDTLETSAYDIIDFIEYL